MNLYFHVCIVSPVIYFKYLDTSYIASFDFFLILFSYTPMLPSSGFNKSMRCLVERENKAIFSQVYIMCQVDQALV